MTYQDKACSATDRINVQVSGTSQQLSADLPVSAPSTQAIQYVSVDNPTICLFGTGCPSVANVKFKVVDSSGVGKSGVAVGFTLNASVLGAANLGSSAGTTDSNGEVSVAVSSLSTPTPLRVSATVTGSSPVISTVSNLLTISGGLPVAGLTDNHTGMSFAAEKYALNNGLDGDKSQITLRLTDRWGQPAIDGTSVTLVSDGGTVVPGNCATSGGSCSVNLLVSNPRPTNGRVHIVAYAAGQEYFVDGSGTGTVNGVQDGTETTDDVHVAVCLDKNENNTCDVSNGEFVIGPSPSATDPNAGNGSWDNTGAFARESRLMFFSRTDVVPRLYKYDPLQTNPCTNTPVDAAYMTVSMGTAVRKFISFCVRDGNTSADSFGGNPIMSGSLVSIAASISTVTASIDNSPIPAVVTGPTVHTVVIKNSSTTSPPTALASGGAADITFDMGGNKYTLLNAVTINP